MDVQLSELPLVIGRYLLMIQLTDLLDIGIMIFVLYKVLMLVQSTKAASLLKGLFVFLGALLLSYILQLHSVNYILSSMVDMGVLALIILFQPEIRRAMERFGGKFCPYRGRQRHRADHRPDSPGLHGDVPVPHRCADRL